MNSDNTESYSIEELLKRIGESSERKEIILRSSFPRGIKFSSAPPQFSSTPFQREPTPPQRELHWLDTEQPEWKKQTRVGEQIFFKGVSRGDEEGPVLRYLRPKEPEEPEVKKLGVRRPTRELPDVVLKLRPTPDVYYTFLERLRTEAIRQLEEHFGQGKINIIFSHAPRITETLIDNFYIGHLYGLGWSDVCNALTAPLLSNECVYALDDEYDNHSDNDKKNDKSIGLAKALTKRSDMYALLYLLLEPKKRPDLWGLLSQMHLSVEALFRMEKIRDINDYTARVMLEHIGSAYRYFFEPSDKIYLDIGTHMTLFLELIGDLVSNKKEFEKDFDVLKRYSNASRRMIDIGDSLSDLGEDIENHILSPFASFTYHLCSEVERGSILRTVSSGVYNKEMQKILQAYAQRMTKANMEYISNINPSSRRSGSVKERFLGLGEIVLEMTENLEAGRRDYTEFYTQTLSQLILSP